MDEIEVSLEVRWDGVLQRADSLLAGLRVSEHSEVGIEHLVGLADGHRDAEPIPSGRDGGGSDAVGREEGVDGLHGLRLGGDELFNLDA